MNTLPIAQIGEPVLRSQAQPLSRDELADPATQRFIDELVATMRAANGAGLAATQVFRALRIQAIEVGDNPRYPYKPRIPLTILVNPVVTALSDETFENYEGCLSVPGLRGVVRRAVGVRVRGWDRHGEDVDFQVWGLSAGTYQHEVDHLDGVLFVDRVEDPHTLCTWEVFVRDHQAAVAERAAALVARYGA